MYFPIKKDAVSYYNKLSTSYNHLFAEDISDEGKKRFCVAPADAIYDRITDSDESTHYYEMWTDKDKMYFSLDVDMDNVDDEDSIVASYIVNVMDGAKRRYNYEYKMSNVIVLRTESSKKSSFHVIFRGLCFENYLTCKDFYEYLDGAYDMRFCDKSIYKLTCLRLCLNSKMGKEKRLMPIVLTINDEDTMNLDNMTSANWKLTMITYVGKYEMLINNPKQKKTTKANQSIDNVDIRKILYGLPSRYYDDYDSWCKIGFILHGIGDNMFDLWNEWSQLSDKYDSKKMKNKWKSFGNNSSSKLSVGSLIKWAADEEITDIFINSGKTSIKEVVDEYPVKDICISEKYKQKQTVVNMNKLTPEIISQHVNNKLLAIQSEKGTGKTYNLLKVLFAGNMVKETTKILFISSRRTFGIKLLDDLREYGFELYSEIKEQTIHAKRLICQIDSLSRISVPRYDYLIVDECESLARYLTSTHFVKNQKANYTVCLFENHIRAAKNVYIMDADLSDRCLNYYTNAMNDPQMHLIINEYKLYSDYTIQYMSYYGWLEKLLVLIREDNKIVIPMASNNKAKDLYEKIKKEYPNKRMMLINKETPDDEKLGKLLKINEIWAQYEIIIYTPSVCMGVSFDVPDHFDYICAYGCTNSLGAQEFCQMLHRIRNPKNKRIYLGMDYYKKNADTADEIEYEQIESMLCNDYYLNNYDLHNNLLMKKVANDRTIVYPYKDEPIYDLYVRNSMETIGNKLNFSAEFFGYAKSKGYILSYETEGKDQKKALEEEMNQIKNERKAKETQEMVEGIMSAKMLTKEEFYNKIQKKDEYTDDKDRYEIKKYNLVNCYGMENDTKITETFIETYFDKMLMRWYKNISTILNTKNQKTEEKLGIMRAMCGKEHIYHNNCYLDFTNHNKYHYHLYALSMIKIMGFDINDLNIVLNRTTLEANLETCIDWCDSYKLELANKFDVKILHKNIKQIATPAHKLKFVNNILNLQYGLLIVHDKKYNYVMTHKNIWANIEDNDVVLPNGWNESVKPIELIDKYRDDDCITNQNTSCLDEFIE